MTKRKEEDEAGFIRHGKDWVEDVGAEDITKELWKKKRIGIYFDNIEDLDETKYRGRMEKKGHSKKKIESQIKQINEFKKWDKSGRRVIAASYGVPEAKGKMLIGMIKPGSFKTPRNLLTRYGRRSYLSHQKR